MNIYNVSGCCGVQEIAFISHHETTEDAMFAFCSAELGIRYGMRLPLSGSYIFTGVVASPEERPQYGQRFEAFIKKHKLGTVTRSHSFTNRRNHPDNTLRVWVWSPNERNLRAWFRKYTGR